MLGLAKQGLYVSCVLPPAIGIYGTMLAGAAAEVAVAACVEIGYGAARTAVSCAGSAARSSASQLLGGSGQVLPLFARSA